MARTIQTKPRARATPPVIASRVAKQTTVKATKAKKDPKKYSIVLEELHRRKVEREIGNIAATGLIADAGYGLGLPKGSNESFPEFIEVTQESARQCEPHCMLHCRRKICLRLRSVWRGNTYYDDSRDVEPRCEHLQSCRDVLRLRHGLRPLALLRAPLRFY